MTLTLFFFFLNRNTIVFPTLTQYITILHSSRKQRRKTQTGKGSDCSWPNERFQFQLGKQHIENRKHDKLQVRVFDKEPLRRKNHLGSVIISMAGVGVHKIDSWFALEGGETNQRAEVHLTISIKESKDA